MVENAQNAPLFSLITVTLNNLEGLKKTYKSIEKQTLKDFEWIVIDGKSSDQTTKWLENISAHWISEPDNGLYDAMNKGIARAKGQYLLFLNAGDQLAASDTLQKISETLKTQKPDFIYGDALENTHPKQFYKKARDHSKISQGMITHHQAMLYKRTIVAKQRYDLTYALAADYDFTARFLEKATSFYKCDFPLCVFEIGGLSQIHAHQSRNEEIEIRRKLKLASPLSNALITTRQRMALALKTYCPSLYKALRECA